MLYLLARYRTSRPASQSLDQPSLKLAPCRSVAQAAVGQQPL